MQNKYKIIVVQDGVKNYTANNDELNVVDEKDAGLFTAEEASEFVAYMCANIWSNNFEAVTIIPCALA